MRYGKLTERPEFFRLTEDEHPLKRGLVFAGLGLAHKSTLYQDSSLRGNHGTLTNMEAEDWAFAPTLNRFALAFGGTDEYVSLSYVASRMISLPASVSYWIKAADPTTDTPAFHNNHSGTSNVGIWTGIANVTASKISISYGANTGTGASSRRTLTGGTSIAADTWTHVLAIITGATTGAIYINGVAESLTASGTGGALAYRADYTGGLGYRGATTVWYSVASLADVMFWAGDLSWAASMLADRSNVMLSGLILPPRRRLWAVVSAPIGTTVNCTCGTITLADYAVNVSVGTTINCTCDTVAIASFAADIQPTKVVACTADTLTVAGNACTISAGSTINCTCGAVEVAGQTVSVDLGVTIACSCGTVEIAAQTATVQQTASINCTLGAIVLAALNATVQSGVTITLSSAALQIAGLAATITSGGGVVADGIDYRAADSRPHYSAANHRPHYRATDNRPHYGV